MVETIEDQTPYEEALLPFTHNIASLYPMWTLTPSLCDSIFSGIKLVAASVLLSSCICLLSWLQVVFRGYHTSDKLEKLHDRAVERRSALKVQMESEQQSQDLTDSKLINEQQRNILRKAEVKVRQPCCGTIVLSVISIFEIVWCPVLWPGVLCY